MLELETYHKRGPKTQFYMLITSAWWMILLGIGFIYLAWAMYYGQLNGWTTTYLAKHPTWYIDVSMVSEWSLLFGISILFIGYLRARVLYGEYKFRLDPNAFHLKRGLIFVREVTIPYYQISNVHVLRPYLYRLFGLAQIDVVTTSDRVLTKRGHRTKDYLIPIIDTSVARQLSRQLIEYSSRSKDGEEITDDYEIDYEDEEGDQNTESTKN